MATAQQTRPSTETKTFGQIFPAEQITETMSGIFVKKLLAIAISSVTYIRTIFPEQAFTDKYLEDLNLKVLREKSSCPGACQVVKWIRGCFDALEKKYLRSIVIGIYENPDDPKTVLESYTFKVAYHNEGEIDIYRNGKKISSAHSPEETKKATIKLLRTIIMLTHTLKDLPDSVMMTMKLHYYDDVTPEDYEPPGFKPADGDEDFVFTEETTTVSVGDVNTKFHGIKMRLKTNKKVFESDEEMEEHTEMHDKANNIEHTALSQPKEKECDPNNREKSLTQESSQDIRDLTQSSENKFQVRCPCGCNEDEGLMVMCSLCNFWQHGICFLITSAEQTPEVHICDVCANTESNIQPTDKQLLGMSSIAVQATCLWRRALMACLEFKRIVAPEFARRLGIENTVAQGLINRLVKEGFVSNRGRNNKLGKTVMKDKIEKEGIPKYFENKYNKLKEKELEKTTVVSGQHQEIEVNMDGIVHQTTNLNLKENDVNEKRSTRGSRSKKRPHSKLKDDLEIVNSQEEYRPKSKRSTVSRDIPV